MLFEKTYGIDLGSSSVKVYSFFKNKSYIEKNMIASKGRKIIAMGNEAYEMFEKSPADISVCSPMTFGMIANLELQEIMTALLTAEDNTDLIYSFKSAHVVIESEEAVPWTLDGEFGGDQTHVEIDNLHEAMNLYLTSSKKQKKSRLNQKMQELKEITQNSEE